MGFTIKNAKESDIPQITAIYNHYILHSTASYEEFPLTEEYMLRKYDHVVAHYPFLVAIDKKGTVAGFAYADSFRPQSGWKLVEATIYLNPEHTGQGIGKKLYKKLISQLKKCPGVLGVVAMISLDNEASIRFHENLGFSLVGKWENCAIKFGKKIGTGSWLLKFSKAG